MASLINRVPPSMMTFRKMMYNLSGFNKYGLFRDDLLYENEDVQEALRRVPEKTIDERNFRLVRAAQLSMQKIYLPKNEWTKFEDDLNNRYLEPFVKQVAKEREEREKWESNH